MPRNGYRRLLVVTIALALVPGVQIAKETGDKEEHPLAGLALRSIGPAITGGRISDFAFHPERKQEFYVATASGTGSL